MEHGDETLWKFEIFDLRDDGHSICLRALNEAIEGSPLSTLGCRSSKSVLDGSFSTHTAPSKLPHVPSQADGGLKAGFFPSAQVCIGDAG